MYDSVSSDNLGIIFNVQYTSINLFNVHKHDNSWVYARQKWF